jgi:hypothetical protein
MKIVRLVHRVKLFSLLYHIFPFVALHKEESAWYHNEEENHFSGKRGRVVEGSSLENCSTGNGTEGSNPSASAVAVYYVKTSSPFCG